MPEDTYIDKDDPEDSDLMEDIEWEEPRIKVSYNDEEDDE